MFTKRMLLAYSKTCSYSPRLLTSGHCFPVFKDTFPLAWLPSAFSYFPSYSGLLLFFTYLAFICLLRAAPLFLFVNCFIIILFQPHRLLRNSLGQSNGFRDAQYNPILVQLLELTGKGGFLCKETYYHKKNVRLGLLGATIMEECV